MAQVKEWKHTIRLKDVFYNERLSFTERRDVIVKRVKNSPWYTESGDHLKDLIDELAGAEDVDEFDIVWNAIYDEADADRVWISIRV